MKAILFDAYGTLLDVHSSVARHADRLGSVAGAVSALWRQKQLEYTWTLTLAGRYRPFDAVTADALDFALALHGYADATLRHDLLGSYRHLAPFADVGPALTQLKAAGMRLGILSNGTPALLREAVASAGIAALLDPLLSVDAIRIYKPDPRVYALALDRFGIRDPAEVVFVTANPWDAHGAASFGFQVIRVNRNGLADENLPGKVSAHVKSLSEIPALLS